MKVWGHCVLHHRKDGGTYDVPDNVTAGKKISRNAVPERERHVNLYVRVRLLSYIEVFWVEINKKFY